MSRRSLLLILTAAAVVAITGFWLVTRYVRKTVQQQVAALSKPEERQVDLGTVVTRVRDLNRLETASMRVVHVSTITQSYTIVPNAIAGDQLTLFATGDVIAGVDLARLKPNDVWRDADGTLVMRLPPSELLMSRIDNGETRVISRKTGVFRRADSGLEGRAREHAESGIRSEAVQRGILPLASRNAETKLADLAHAMGFAKVRFISAGAPIAH